MTAVEIRAPLGVSLSTGFSATGYMPGTSKWRTRPPRVEATGPASQPRLGPFLAWEQTALARKAPFPDPARDATGPGGLGEPRARRVGARKGSRGSPGRGVSRWEAAVKSRTEVARPRPAPGALVMWLWGGRGPRPGARLLCGASSVRGQGVVPGPARFDIHLPSPAIVSFRDRKEGGDFSQSIMNSGRSLSSLPLLLPPPWFPPGAGRLQDPCARALEHRGPGPRVPRRVGDTERAAP